jgi:hypothetical protein
MRPTLGALGIEQHTLTKLEDVEFVIDRTLKQAFATQESAAIILNPRLTGGKVFKSKDPS